MTIKLHREVVLLAAHGAGDESWANQRIHQLAQALTNTGLEARAGFHLGTPSIEEVLGGEESVRAVLPLFAAPGYFATERIPARVMAAKPDVEILDPICQSVRFVRAAVALVLSRLPTGVGTTSFEHILVVGHGTERHPGSRLVVDRVVAALNRRLPWLGVDTVTAGFLDQRPRVDDVWRRLDGAVLVLPLLLGGGPHVEELEQMVRGRPQSRMLPAVLEWPLLLDFLRSHVIDGRLDPPAPLKRPMPAPRLWRVR